MRYVRDLASGLVDPVVIDYPFEAGTYVVGQPMALGLSDGNDLNFAITGAAAKSLAGTAILGICNEGIVSTLDIDDATTYKSSNFGKLCINPGAVYEAEIDLTSKIDMASELAFTCTSNKGYPHAGGNWIYIVAGAGLGDLLLVEDSSVATTTCTLVLSSAASATTGATTDFVFVPGFGQQTVSFGATKIDSNIDAGSTLTGEYGVAVFVVGSYIRTDAIRKRLIGMGGAVGQGLDDARTGLNNENVKFFTQFVLGARSHAFGLSITRA